MKQSSNYNIFTKNVSKSSRSDNIFSNEESIKDYDSELWQSFEFEALRQEDHIELIASENYASKRILEAQGSLLRIIYL